MRTASNPALPPFPTHGGGNLGPNFPGPYPVLPASLSLTPAADDFPMDPPAMPRDAEMLKNIDILSSFVVKNGPDFEQLARKKQSADPKFAFLFGGEPGTDAAIGQRYYEWKKHALEASLWSQGGSSLCSGRGSIQDEVKLTSDALASPVGSDMEMEDDFDAPPSAVEKDVASPVQVIEAKVFPVIEVNEWEEAVSVSEGRNFRAVAPGAKQPDTGSGPKGDIPPASGRRKDTRRRTGFDRSCMEVIISPRRKSASPPEQALLHGRERVSHQERKLSSGVNGHQTEGAPRGSWQGPPEPSLTPEAPKLDMASSPQVLQKSEVREKLEAVCTPNADVVDLSEFHGRTDAKGIQDPKKLKHDRISSGLELGAPTVDEFGRLVRHDSSDSDGEDGHHGKKRRRSTSWSRSRSQSPREKLQQCRSRSQSRSRRSRRSRSRSYSSRQQRSYSRSPPQDSRRGADSSWGSDRRFQECGARRGGRGEWGGGTQPICIDFSRGRCQRGSSCRFLHSDNSSNGASSGDPGRGGGRYGPRGGQGSRGENNDDGRTWGSARSSSGRADEGSRARKNWDSTTEREKENTKETVLEDRGRCKPEESPTSAYSDDQSAKLIKTETKEKTESKTVASKPLSFTDPPPLARLPTNALFALPHSSSFDPDVVNSSIVTLPPQAPAISVSQAFSSVPSAQPVPAFATDVPEKDYTTNISIMQPGFDGSIPPPSPMVGFMGHHHPSSQLQAPYPAPTPQATAYSQSGGHPQPGGFPQMGLQQLPVPSRPGLPWPIAYVINQSMQGYGLPGPASSLAQQTNPQHVSQHLGVSASKEQYDPLIADAFEPEPPGARVVGPNPEFGGPQDMSMVIMESVSPGLPSHHHPVTNSVNQGTHNGLVMESVNATTVVPSGEQRSHSVMELLPSHPAVEVSTYRSLQSQPDDQGGGVLENVSPALNENRNWNSGLFPSERDSGQTRDRKDRDGNQSQVAGQNEKEGCSRAGRGKEGQDKEGGQKEGHGLTLIRAAVTEYVKDVLKPTWREGHMSKEAFKTIAKKAVDKVLGALQPHQIPKTPEKVDNYMASSRPKIHKLVQGYVDKYVKI